MKRLLLFLCFLQPLFGQGPPDCKVNFTFTATGRQPTNGFPNGTPLEPGCVTWTIVYYNTGFSALSLRLDSAPDASGIAGAWISFSGTLVVGVNPNTTTTQNYTVITGYNPWVSVNLTSVTGTGRVSGTAYGWKNPGFTYTSAGGGGAASNVNLIQVGGAAVALGQAAMSASIPVVIASDQTAVKVNGQAASGAADAGNPVKIGGSNGTNDYNLFVDSQGNDYKLAGCPSSATFALTTSGSTRIVTGVASQQIRICTIDFTSDGLSNIKLVYGTGAACTTPTNLTGLYATVATYSNDFSGSLRSAATADLCLNQSGNSVTGGTITYAQF